jgi:hypothetical protein
MTLVAACVNHPGDDTQQQPDGGVIGNPVTPRTGIWYYDGVTAVSNSCNSAIREDAPGNFLIVTASSTTFHVDPNDGNPVFDCSLANGSFDCPNRIAAVQDFRPTVDAVATIHVDADGTFSSTLRGTGAQKATVDCVGSACAAYGPWPCHFQQNFAITAQ